MDSLLRQPLANGKIIRFAEGIEEHVDKVPIFQLCQLMLSEIEKAGNLKLTAKGNIPVKLCKLLDDTNLLPRYKFARLLEDEIAYIWPLKQFLLDQGLIKKRNNSLSVTKRGKQAIAEPKSLLFFQLFIYMTQRFHWSNFYRIDDGGQVGQLGWAYSLLQLFRHGSVSRDSSFYSEKWIKAFDHIPSNDPYAREGWEHYAFRVRFFENFAQWFGLVELTKESVPGRFLDDLLVKRSDLFEYLLNFSDLGSV